MLPEDPASQPTFDCDQARRFWSKKWRNGRHSKQNPMVLKCALCAAKKPHPGPSWNKPLKDNVVVKEDKKRLRNEE